MHRRSAIVCATVCLGCSPGGGAQMSTTPKSQVSLSTSQQSKTLSAAGFCEFNLGQPVPSAQQPIATRTIPTEGDDRVFAEYRSCQGRVPITIELRDDLVWSISIKGVGNCLSSLICVGDSYRQAIDQFPTARQLLSREEGKVFSLFVREGLTLVFPAETLADECFVRPSSCAEQIQLSRIESVLIYSH
jgi:hypothetical protein